MAPHSSTLAWKIPWTEEPGGLQSMGSLGVRHDWVTSLSLFTFVHWRRKWQPTPVFLPGESRGWGSLVGCRLWGRTESTRLKRLSSSSSSRYLKEFSAFLYMGNTRVWAHWSHFFDVHLSSLGPVLPFSSWVSSGCPADRGWLTARSGTSWLHPRFPEGSLQLRCGGSVAAPCYWCGRQSFVFTGVSTTSAPLV